MIAVAAVVAALAAIWGYVVIREEVNRRVEDVATKQAVEVATRITNVMVPRLVSEATQFSRQGGKRKLTKLPMNTVKRPNQMDSVFEIVERYWNRAPVDIVSIIRDAGIFYAEEPLWSVESGLIDQVDGTYRIVVNSEHPLVRRRFTAAHELGHYVYHRDLIGNGISDAAYRTGDTGRYQNSNITPRHETQANQFAATTLMPSHLIKQLSQHFAVPARIADMARELLVSEKALRIRLGL